MEINNLIFSNHNALIPNDGFPLLKKPTISMENGTNQI
jgi:hypothetical protein